MTHLACLSSQPILHNYMDVTDHDVLKRTSMKSVIQAIKRTFAEQARGTLVSPPRFRVETDQGDLVFTAGAAIGLEKVIGFRVYDTCDNDFDGHEQVVCVFDSDTGIFRGIMIGNLLGAIRTGAIGGVAIDHMARPDAHQIAVIGTGLQARTQLEAAVAVRELHHIRVYSRKDANRKSFAEEMTQKLGIDVVPVASAKDCVEDADIVICATNSGISVFEAEWIKPGTHVNTIGPKSVGRHEVPIQLVTRSAVISTDSIEQLGAYTQPHFLMGTPVENRIIQLCPIL